MLTSFNSFIPDDLFQQVEEMRHLKNKKMIPIVSRGSKILMKTFESRYGLFPMCVFSVAKEKIGVATDLASYCRIWNAHYENAEYGKIIPTVYPASVDFVTEGSFILNAVYGEPVTRDELG